MVTIPVNIDALAVELGVTTQFLKQRIYDYGMGYLANEALRQVAIEEWDALQKLEPKARRRPALSQPHVELRHLVAASKQELDLTALE